MTIDIRPLDDGGGTTGGLGGGTAGGLGSTVRNRDLNAAWRHVDVVLCALVATTAAFGSLMIYSATRHRSDPTELISKHLIYVMVGVGAMALCAAVDYERLRSLSRLIYIGCLGALGLVLVPGIGALHKGIRAWFDIGPIQIQPAEPAKLAVIILLASYLGSLERILVRHAVVALVMLGAPMALIMLQPDLGTTLVFVVIGAGMLLVAGVPARFLIALMVISVVGVIGILKSDTLDQYQRDRLTAFAAPDSASGDITYNTKQAQTAIASGGTTGKGLFDGPQTKGGFVPEQQTDFIFTVPGEELGFVGSVVLLLLLGGIVWRTWRIAGLASDRVGMLMSVGVLCLFAFHIFENVGMNLGIMPVTGIPLPFVSYGGSSTITAFAGMGLVLNVHMRRYR